MVTEKSDEKSKAAAAEISSAASLEAETRNNVEKIVAIEDAEKARRTVGERIAEFVAAFCGSMTFVYVHIIWFASWIIVNSYKQLQFDPFPYTFLTLVVSLEAIFLSTFILISQNHETHLTERRNHLDLQINMLSEQENTKMLDLLQRIAVKVGIEDDDAATAALLEPMEPDQLIDQIVHAIGPSGKDKKDPAEE